MFSVYADNREHVRDYDTAAEAVSELFNCWLEEERQQYFAVHDAAGNPVALLFSCPAWKNDDEHYTSTIVHVRSLIAAGIYEAFTVVYHTRPADADFKRSFPEATRMFDRCEVSKAGDSRPGSAAKTIAKLFPA